MAGANPVSMPIEIHSQAKNIKSYGFSLPNGDALIALWTDGLPVDEDAGINSTLILSGRSAQQVMVMDALHGKQQQAITRTESSALAIRNLLLKDYPIILRLIKRPRAH